MDPPFGILHPDTHPDSAGSRPGETSRHERVAGWEDERNAEVLRDSKRRQGMREVFAHALPLSLQDRHWPMVVAVVAVRMVQSAVDQIIEVVAVGHLLVPAVLVLALASDRSADGRVGLAHFEFALVVVAGVFAMHVAIVQEIDVAVVLDASVAAMFAVGVRVVVVVLAVHIRSPWLKGQINPTLSFYSCDRLSQLLNLKRLGIILSACVYHHVVPWYHSV
jgi:hypothetical protein